VIAGFLIKQNICWSLDYYGSRSCKVITLWKQTSPLFWKNSWEEKHDCQEENVLDVFTKPFNKTWTYQVRTTLGLFVWCFLAEILQKCQPKLKVIFDASKLNRVKFGQ